MRTSAIVSSRFGPVNPGARPAITHDAPRTPASDSTDTATASSANTVRAICAAASVSPRARRPE